MARRKADTVSDKIVTEERITDILGQEEPKQVEPVKDLRGFEWSKIEGVDEELERCLWDAGVTEIGHLTYNVQNAVNAFQRYYGLDVARLRERAREYINNE